MQQWVRIGGLGLGVLGLVGLLALTSQPLSRSALEETYAYGTNTPGETTYQYTTTVPNDQPFAYAVQGEETGPYQYSVMSAPAPDTYSYAAQAAPEQTSYTYSTMAETGGPSTYTAQPVADQTYTYSAVQGPDSMTTYTAAPNPPAMTVINGYATDKPAMEQWYTVPMGTLHPTDSAGNAAYGAFDSVNPDGTARSMAPLTLTGERADGTVAQDAVRQRIGLVSSHLKAARLSQLAEIESGEKESSKSLARVPVSQVADLSPTQRKQWAEQVIKVHKLHKVWQTPENKVKSLTPKQQKEWAKHVIASEKEAPKDPWADKVQEYLWHKKMQSSHRGQVTAHRPLTKARKTAAPLKKFDKFGLPELNGLWTKGWDEAKVQSWKGIRSSLTSGRGCGTMCRQRAIASVASSIPIA